MSPKNGRRLSVVRVAAVIVVVALAVTGVVIGLRVKEAEANAAAVTSLFAPYVDVTATPQYAFEDATGSAPTSAILSFVVSALDAPCEPELGRRRTPWPRRRTVSASTGGWPGCGSWAAR